MNTPRYGRHKCTEACLKNVHTDFGTSRQITTLTPRARLKPKCIGAAPNLINDSYVPV